MWLRAPAGGRSVEAVCCLYFVPMVSLFFYPYNRSPVVGLALSIAFQLCMLLAAYNADVVLVGLRRKVRTLGRWDLARQRS
eukprot:scaffold11693_cov64-Phaeocystis_antarctica.AAC.2